MVQRAGLALILLLALAASMLSAQAEGGFTPPKLLSEPVLELPAGWQETYDPPEVMILVEVAPDSAATLVKILDGKNGLQNILENQLTSFAFQPAVADGKPITAQLTVKLKIRSAPRSEQLRPRVTERDSLPQVDRDRLFGWLNRQRQTGDLQRLFSTDSLSAAGYLPRMYDAFYRTNYYLLGLNGSSAPVLKDGFIQPAPVYLKALEYLMSSTFRSLKASDGAVAYANDKFDSPAMLADIYAGLGDYEFNFARASVLKNHLLGVKDLYLEAGFLVQNGWWQEVISDQTSYRVFVSAPVKGTTISFNIEQYNQDIPATALVSGLQDGSQFALGHWQHSYYLKWQLHWFTVGWQGGKETFRAPGKIITQNYRQEQVLLQTAYQTAWSDLELTYQFSYQNKGQIPQQLYQYALKPDHQALLQAGKMLGRADYGMAALVSEAGLDRAELDLGYGRRFGRLGLNYVFYDGNRQAFNNGFLYQDASLRALSPAVFTRQQAAFRYTLPESGRRFRLDFTAGYKQVSTTTGSDINTDTLRCSDKTISNQTRVSELMFCTAYSKINLHIAKLDCKLEQTLLWNQYARGSFELPELQVQTCLRLTRELKYKNALMAGLNLTGHTDYTNAYVSQTPIYGGLAADIWAGVKITDLFEFQLMMKNLGGNFLYGVSPHPRTIIGTIHWFFLN